jgi:SEC-C motif-containing protein
MTCPCGNPPSFDACCGPIVRGERMPATAEALMRARYTAYTRAEVDFILATHAPEAQGDVDRESTETWAKESTWLGLEIVSTAGGGAADDTGEVEFIARYRVKDAEAAHHERAQFRRIDGRWYFASGEMVKPRPVVREAPRVGRNEPCPCGSGKKWKKCCGA